MYTEESFEAMGPGPALAAGEYVIWKGKPKKSAYIADKANVQIVLTDIAGEYEDQAKLVDSFIEELGE